MWKKSVVESSPAVSTSRVEPVSTGNSREIALVGPSIVITGGLAGEEDVCIQGRVEGTVHFKGYSVTIGEHGRVKADIHAREILVEGKLEGNLYGEEKVHIRASGKVVGNIEAPRVVMEDGALFKGAVDMSKRDMANVTDNAHKETLSKMPSSSQGSKSTMVQTKTVPGTGRTGSTG
ncbi:MAG: polymer-forming cytoskeletal protein [Gammaproteobacteria bacterium]|nr:polymer-forming cytoskeletal protein [Gammaproteobacteria bacterium]